MLLVLGILFIYTVTAHAGFNYGVKVLSLSQLNIGAGSFEGLVSYPINQTLGGYFGIDVTPTIVILGGIDLNRFQNKYTDSYLGVVNKSELSMTQFIPNIGVKFYFKPRASGDFSPYVYGGLFKCFASTNYENTGSSAEYIQYYEEITKEINSPFGFIPAFGVEYYFSDNFGLGGEVGWRFSFAKADFDWSDGEKEEYKYNTISNYFGLTANFHF
jgi:hypothetical protein